MRAKVFTKGRPCPTSIRAFRAAVRASRLAARPSTKKQLRLLRSMQVAAITGTLPSTVISFSRISSPSLCTRPGNRSPRSHRRIGGASRAYQRIINASRSIHANRPASSADSSDLPTAHDARDGVEFSVADPDLDLRLRLDVAHPVGALSLGRVVRLGADRSKSHRVFRFLPAEGIPASSTSAPS